MNRLDEIKNWHDKRHGPGKCTPANCDTAWLIARVEQLTERIEQLEAKNDAKG